MRRCGYSKYVLKESEALVHGHIGCVGRFFRIPTASCSVPLRTGQIFVYGLDKNRAINCVVERSNRQLDYGKTNQHP